ncbi:MAG: hypothetical protein EXR39_17365 [Betaproteobacteria bacterium]|nr:hypothetical protein [Betaproteobacteria bacterium]
MNQLVGPEGPPFNPAQWLPACIGEITDHQTDLPRIARDPRLTSAIDAQLPQIPTKHDLHLRDSRAIDFLPPNSIHLVVTSPPYWTLKEYNHSDGQMGEIADYEKFLSEPRFVEQLTRPGTCSRTYWMAAVRAGLPIRADGTIAYAARANAIKARVPSQKPIAPSWRR